MLTKNEVIPTIIEDKSNHNESTTSNNYYDNKILRTEYKGTIVFEADSSAPTTVTNKKKKKQKKAIPLDTQTPKEQTEKLAQLLSTVADLIDDDIVEYVFGILLEDPFDEDTREFVRGILMEALSSQFDVDGAVFCVQSFCFIRWYQYHH